MDELEIKANKGLESFSKKGDIRSVKASLDGMVDDMLGEDEIHPKNNNSGSNVKWFYIAFAVLSLALIGYLGYKDGGKNQKTVESQVLYAQYFEVLPDAISGIERGSEKESEVQSDTDLAMGYYAKGDYESAAKILKSQDDLDYIVFGAIAEMKINQHESAIDLLKKSQQLDTTNRYKDITEWYLALSYLKIHDIQKAKTKLTTIAKSNHYKSSEAKMILKSLE